MADDQSQDDIQISPSSEDGKVGAGSGQQGAQTAKGSGPSRGKGTGTSGTGAGQTTGAPLSLEEEAAQATTGMAPPPKYSLPAMVKKKFPDMLNLIEETESMNEEEREYWFQIMPIMTEDQISKFRDILLNEKKQLESLDKEYEQQLTQLNEKHMIEWREFETKEKRKALAGAEKAAEADEKAKEEDLLARLAEI